MTLIAYTPIPDGSLAVPSLWNSRMSILQENIVSLRSDKRSTISQGSDKSQILVPSQSMWTLPGLAWDNNVQTGLYQPAANQIGFTLSGVSQFEMAVNQLRGSKTSAPLIVNDSATSTNPTIIPIKGDDDTGIGSDVTSTNSNTMSLICGGLETMRLSGRTIRFSQSGSPTGTASADTGDVSWDSTYFYMCVSVNSWRRIAWTAF